MNRIHKAWNALRGIDPMRHVVSIHLGGDGKWFWHEQGQNGEITCFSEGFDGPPAQSRASALRAAHDHCNAERVVDA